MRSEVLIATDESFNKNQEWFFDRETSCRDKSEIFSYKYCFCLRHREYNNDLHSQITHRIISKVVTSISKMNEMTFANLLLIIEQQIQRSVQQKEKKQVHIKCLKLFMKEVVGFFSFISKNTSNKGRQDQIIKNKATIIVGIDIKKSHILQKRLTIRMSLNNTIPEPQIIHNNANHSFLYARDDTISSHQTNLTRYLEQFSHKNIKILTARHAAHFYLVDFNEKLGSGGFGNVFKAQSIQLIEDCMKVEICAIKQLKKGISDYKQQGFTISQDREYKVLDLMGRLLKQKKHLNGGQYIIELKQVLTYNDKRYLVYEYCAHNHLKEFIKSGSQKLTKIHIINIIYQLVIVLKLIHYDMIGQSNQIFTHFSLEHENDAQLKRDAQIYSETTNMAAKIKGIIHRDLKTNNIMVKKITSNFIQIKIIDWAFSKRTLTEETVCKTVCGTPSYQAPQISENQNYNCKADIWSIGSIIYELLTGECFVSKNNTNMINQKLLFKTKIKDMKFINDIYLIKQQEFFKEVMVHCLECDIQKRWSSLQLYNYLQQVFENKTIFNIFGHEQYQRLIHLRTAFNLYKMHNYNLSSLCFKKIAIERKLLGEIQKFIKNSFTAIVDRYLLNTIILNEQYCHLAEEMLKLSNGFADKRKSYSVPQLVSNLIYSFNDYKQIKEVCQIINYFEKQFTQTNYKQVHQCNKLIK